ncbi:MAG: hypothetical protein IPF47_20530 [Gemmatimonadetes bacterium]|jgi:hypothetical protein|nr:hypothetical protein [Gemmatimonadota bacterium]
MAAESVSWGGVAARVVAAAVLVFSTYNPEGYSFYHWAVAPLLQDIKSFDAVKFLAGTVLLAGWVVYIQATRRSIGWMGALLVTAIAGGVIWLLIDRHLVSATSSRGITNVVLIAVSIVLGVGMSWSHFSRRITGQADTDVV